MTFSIQGIEQILKANNNVLVTNLMKIVVNRKLLDNLIVSLSKLSNDEDNDKSRGSNDIEDGNNYPNLYIFINN